MIKTLRDILSHFQPKPSKIAQRPRSFRKKETLPRRPQPATLLGAKGFSVGYLNMPKAACTSVKNILYFLNNGIWYADPLHIHKAIRYAQRTGLDSVVLSGESYLANRTQLLAKGKEWLNFTFVRDPGPRAYSAFVEKIWATGPYSFPGIREHLVKLGSLTLSPLSSNEVPDKGVVAANFLAFLDFVSENLAGRTTFHANPHWCVQSTRIEQSRGARKIDFVGRVERFSDDMNFVLRTGGYNGPNLVDKRFNEGPRPPNTLSEIMNAQIASRLSDIYSEDYDSYGYKRPRQT
jgi:hypothetical protein